MRPPVENPPPADPTADQAVWDEVTAALDRLSDAARRDLTPDAFYRELIATLAPLLAADHAAVWLRDANTAIRVVANTASWSEAIGDRAAHEQQVAAALQTTDAQLLAPGEAANATSEYWLLAPVSLRNWLATDAGATAVVAMALPAGRAPSNYQGAKQLVESATDIAAEYHVRRELRRMAQTQQSQYRLTQFAEQVAGDNDLGHTAMAIANEGRGLLACDRLSVLTATPRRAQLRATSGVDRVERRGRTARALERLAAMAVRLDESIYYCDNAGSDVDTERAPQLDAVLRQYADEFHVRQMLVVPMRASDDRAKRRRGVLIAEQFGGQMTPLEPTCLAEVARAATPALDNAMAWDELPLGWLLRGVGWLRMPRTLFRLAAASLLVVGVMASLLAIRTPMSVDVRGQLLPVARQDIFAPRSGIVDQLDVEHGQTVAAGDPLVVLRDPQLAVDMARLRGELTTVEQQLEAVRATRSTAGAAADPLELYRLSAEEQRHRTERDNLSRQLELLDQQAASLCVTTPLAGMVTTWQVQQRLAPGRPVERGQVLLTVADTVGDWQLELDVPDERLDQLRTAGDELLMVEYRLASDASVLHTARLDRLARRVHTDGDDTSEPHPMVRAIATPVSELSNELRAAALRPGGSVQARIVLGDRPLGQVLFNDLWRTLRNWWEF